MKKTRVLALSPEALTRELVDQTLQMVVAIREQCVFVFSEGYVVISGQFDLNAALQASEDEQVSFGLLTPEEKQQRELDRVAAIEAHERAQLARLKMKYEREQEP